MIGCKVGNQVYYSIRHLVLIDVLDLLKQYFNAQLKETVAMLGESGPRRGRRR